MEVRTLSPAPTRQSGRLKARWRTRTTGGSLETTAERLEGNLVRLTVTTPAADVDAAIEKAYREVAGKLRIPGFRPGKAPRAIIDSHVGPEAVLAEAQEDLVDATYPLAIDDEGLRPIESPDMGELDSLVRASRSPSSPRSRSVPSSG